MEAWRRRRSALADLITLWIITVLAYAVVGFLRGHQMIRNGLNWLRPGRDWLS